VKAIRNTVLRAVYRVGYRVLRVFWLATSPPKRGVKCVLMRGPEVILVRHTYGPRRRWELPGGGIKRREEPLDAARRETQEELGVDVSDWRFLGDLFERIDGKRDELYCYRAELGDVRVEPDAAEIAEARWFRPDELPAETHRYVRRILELG
jgi:8-oxo-dGTP pyrophosphatase MutT (NUDIX family)